MTKLKDCPKKPSHSKKADIENEVNKILGVDQVGMCTVSVYGYDCPVYRKGWTQPIYDTDWYVICQV